MPYYQARKRVLPTIKDFNEVWRFYNFYFLKTKKILDYGCGSADNSLIFGLNNHDVTICDIENMLKFARRRFELRNLPVDTLIAKADNTIPLNTYDLIVCIEVIEHLREPFMLLEKVDAVLKTKDVIILGSFPFNPTNSQGDHLIESVCRQEEILKWINERWKRPLNYIKINKDINIFIKE